MGQGTVLRPAGRDREPPRGPGQPSMDGEKNIKSFIQDEGQLPEREAAFFVHLCCFA